MQFSGENIFRMVIVKIRKALEGHNTKTSICFVRKEGMTHGFGRSVKESWVFRRVQ